MFKAYAAHEPDGRCRSSPRRGRRVGWDRIRMARVFHSDLSMLGNHWGMTEYPFVPGHEVSGRVAQLGKGVRDLKVGDRVGLGWHARYCGSCRSCLSGDHNLCAQAQGTIIGRHGGFADKVRASATPTPSRPRLTDGQPERAIPVEVTRIPFCKGSVLREHRPVGWSSLPLCVGR